MPSDSSNKPTKTTNVKVLNVTTAISKHIFGNAKVGRELKPTAFVKL
jgi:hypothetical protein